MMQDDRRPNVSGAPDPAGGGVEGGADPERSARTLRERGSDEKTRPSERDLLSGEPDESADRG